MEEEAKIKEMVLDMCTKFTRTGIDEISERSRIDSNSIILVVQKMIANKEINAVYFNSTKSIAFNQRSNINDIDNLMDKYHSWEKEKTGKIR